MTLSAPPLCVPWKKIFTREGVRIPVPLNWVAELHQIDSAARTLSSILAAIHRDPKPRILAKWEKEPDS